jgi:hypothetical protein
MDPEIVERLNEQLREMYEILSEQNAMMAAQMKSMKDLTAASDKSTKASDKATKATKELTESTEELTKKEEAYARAEKERQEAVQEATDRINKAMGTVANGFLSLGSVIMDSTHSFSKYNGMIGSAGDAALDLGKNFGILGTVIGGVVKAATMLMQYQLAQADSLLKFNDQISKMGAANAFNTDEILSMANKIGFAAKDLDKLMAPMQKLGSTFKQLGNGAVDSTNRFMEMANVGSEVRQEFQRLGYSQAELVEAQAGYVELMGGAGLSLRSFNGEMKTLQKTSLAYVKNLQALSDMTGLSVEDQTKRMAAAAADTQFQLYVADMNKKIASASTEEEKQKLAAQVELAMATKAQITALQGEEAGRGYGQALAGAPITEGLGTMAVSGTLGTIQELARETRAGNINSAKDAAKYTQAITDSSAKAQDQLKIAAAISPDAANLVGGTGGITERNRLFGLDQEKAAADIQKRIDDNAAGKGKAAEDSRQQARNVLTETEIALRTAFDSFAGNLGIASTALIALAGAAGLAALAIAARGGLGKLAKLAGPGATGATAATTAATSGAAAREASKAATKQAAIDAAKAAKAGPGAVAATAAATAAAPAAATASKGAKLAGLAKGGARILGKLAWPLTAIMALGDGISGFGADPKASFGGKLANAGKSALSGATFGLLGSSSEEIAEKAKANETSEKPESKKDESKTAADSKFADAFGKHVDKFGEIVNKLGSTNKGISSSSTATSFGKNIESFGKIVIAFAKTVTAFAKITKTFATITGTFAKAVKMFADQNKSINAMGSINSKVKGKSSGLLGTPMEDDNELDVVDYIERLKTSLADAALSTDSLREAEIKRHRFTEESMMQFRRSLTDASKILNKIAGVDEEDEDASTDGSSPSSSPSSSPDSSPGSSNYADSDSTSTSGSATKVTGGGAGYTNLQYEDGREEKRTGTLAWRNNNPGNIRAGDFARSQGAVGQSGGFAVFSSYEQGRKAKEELLFNTSKYKNKTIAGAISKYAPPNENDTRGYINTIVKALGVNSNTPLRDLTPEQRTAMLNAMEKIEGFKAGKVEVLKEGKNAGQGGGSKDIVALGQRLQDQGIRVAEHPAFGGVAPVHKGRGHYEGRAIDINIGRGVNESKDPKARAKFDQIADSARSDGFKVIWKAPGHYSHMHIESPRKSSLQARKGGLVKGPDSGYPVEMHGSEMITPLTQDSVLAKLAKTPAETPEISNAISSTAPTMEKEILERVVNMNAELVEGMLSKLGDMVSAISDGNDTREKILKNSMV